MSTNNLTELNELIYAGAKLVNNKISVPLKNTKRNSKYVWKIWLERQINIQEVKMKRQRNNAGTCWDEKKKSHSTIKTKNKLKEITGEGRKTKKISSQNKTKQTEQDIPKQRKLFSQQVGWLLVWILWHINHCRLFNAKYIFIQIVSSISNNSV